jgi:hypothetical protein
MYQNSWFHAKLLLPCGRGLFKLVSKIIRYLFRRKSQPQQLPHEPFTREQRASAVARFLLALSDQQLVTGLAILIGAVANRCKITLYEFEMATYLAWFSATTHLVTLDVLKGYLVQHRLLRHCRVAGIVLNFLFLILAIIVLNISTLESTGAAAMVNPVQCVFTFAGGIVPKEHWTFYAVDLAISTATIISNLIITMWTVFPAHIERIFGIYKEDTFAALRREALFAAHKPANLSTSIDMSARVTPTIPLNYGEWWVRQKLKKLKAFHQPGGPDFELVASVEQEIYESHPDHWSAEDRKPPCAKVLGRHRKAIFPHRYLLRYDQSYLSNFPLMIFLFLYGLISIILLRWYAGMSLDPGSKRMDFGQVTALFLLVLPVLTALEVLSGK